jgi:hypothetical protein
VIPFSRPVVLFSIALLIAFPAQAQNWSFDARQIALGSREGGETLASTMMAEANGYHAVVFPFGGSGPGRCRRAQSLERRL